MRDERRDEEYRAPHRRRPGHHRRRRWRVPRDTVEPDEADLSPEEREYRKAHRLAERKLRLAGDAIKLMLVVAVLMIVRRSLGVTILLVGGAILLGKFYRLVLEPRLRERFVAKEVRNQVQATLSEERRLLEGRHARSMEQLSASIAHEIRNPITAAKSLVQQMGEDVSTAENVEYANIALEELDRVERSVSHLLRFARDEEMRMAELRMAEVIDSALETFGDRSARAGVRIERQIDCEGSMTGDPEQLRRVVINLVGNAIEALEEGATPDPRIEVQMGENLAGSEVWLRIGDNGPGLDAEARAKIFSPFYTSKASGTGLGLSICKKLVEAHGGSIEVESEPGRGAEFLISLPKQRRREERPS